jgi:hypothetical protein
MLEGIHGHYMEPGQNMPWVGPKPEGVQYQRIHYGGGDGCGSEAHNAPRMSGARRFTSESAVKVTARHNSKESKDNKDKLAGSKTINAGSELIFKLVGLRRKRWGEDDI